MCRSIKLPATRSGVGSNGRGDLLPRWRQPLIIGNILKAGPQSGLHQAASRSVSLPLSACWFFRYFARTNERLFVCGNVSSYHSQVNPAKRRVRAPIEMEMILLEHGIASGYIADFS